MTALTRFCVLPIPQPYLLDDCTLDLRDYWYKGLTKVYTPIGWSGGRADELGQVSAHAQ